MASSDALSPEQKRQLYQEFGMMETAHTIGVLNLAISVIAAVRFPQVFWIVHLVKACIFLPWRYVRFSQRGWELYLLDFCYVNTYYTVLCCIVTFLSAFCGIPNLLHNYGHAAIRVGFAFANGALLLAIPLFNNKLVFHDIDNTTSMYIHLSPAVMLWTLRWGGGFGTSLIEDWWPGMFDVCPNMRADGFLRSFQSLFWGPDDCEGTFAEFVLYPALCWICLWAMPYALLMFGCLASWIEREHKGCLYQDTLVSKDIMGRIVNAAPEKLKPLAFLGIHLAWTAFSGTFSIILWNSFALHTLYVLAVGTFALHNGSKYMFRYVAAKQVPREIGDIITRSETGDERGRLGQPLLKD